MFKWWNEVAFFVFLFCILGYSILMIVYKATGKKYKRASLDRYYRNWVDTRIDSQDHIVTIQSIRNSIMSNSIFISALLVFLSIILGLFSREYIDNSNDFLGSMTITLGIMQISLITIITVISLVSFVLSVRMLQRSQFLITSNTKKREEIFENTYNLMQKSFLSAQTHWMSGIRALFFLIPTITWLFSPIVFLVATVLITLYLIGWHDLSLLSFKDN
jgi:uncharacterized membrane protein